MAQVIEWSTEPAWGYGDGARPIDLDSLYRRVYQYYNLITIRNENFFPGYSGVYRVYNVGSSDRNIVSNGPIDGFDPGSAMGPDLLSEVPYNKILMTIRFPNAGARWESRMNVTGDPVNGWFMGITTRWLDDDGNVITVNDQGFNTNPSWTIPFTGAGGTAYTAGFPHQFAVTYTVNGETCYGFTMSTADKYSTWSGTYLVWSGDAVCINIREFAAYLQARNPTMDFGVWEVDTESPEAGPASSTSDIHYGGDPRESDSPQVPDVPTATAAALGFINIYNPSAGGLTSLGSEIFPDFDFTSVVDPTGNDLLDAILNGVSALIDGINQIPKMFQVIMNSRLIDYVQDCHIVPVKPSTGSPAHIKLGFRELDTTADVVTNEYVKVSLGTVNVGEIRKMFMDFLPYTRAKLYLPFVGYVPVEPEYFQDGVLGVEYIFNVYDGSFMAFVTSSPSNKVSFMSSAIVGSYTGTAIIHLPLTGLNYSSMVAGLIGGAGAMVSSIASGNPAAAATAAINTATSSPQVMTSNGYTASASFLGYRYPFLVMERSTSHFPQNYSHDVGLPSKITVNLSAAQGFVKISDVDLSGVDAMDSEKEEIRKLLGSGIYC